MRCPLTQAQTKTTKRNAAHPVQPNHHQHQQDQVEAAAQLASDLAMHVAGFKPLYLEPSAVPAAVLEAERKLLLEQAAGSGKAAAVVEKMVQGRLSKWAQEVGALLRWFFVWGGW